MYFLHIIHSQTLQQRKKEDIKKKIGKDNRTLKYTPNLNGLQNKAVSSMTARKQHAKFVPSLQLSTEGNDAFCFHCSTAGREIPN